MIVGKEDARDGVVRVKETENGKDARGDRTRG